MRGGVVLKLDTVLMVVVIDGFAGNGKSRVLGDFPMVFRPISKKKLKIIRNRCKSLTFSFEIS